MTDQYDEMLEQSEEMHRIIASVRNPSSISTAKERAEGLLTSVATANATLAAARKQTAKIGRDADALKKSHEADTMEANRTAAVRQQSIQAKKTANRKIPM